MTEQFIQDLRKSPYFERILNGHDIVMIILTGSRLIDITDDRSDFDLLVITNDKERDEHVSEFLTYCAKKAHWYYVPATKLIDNEGGTLLSCNGEVEFVGLSNEKIIYANPKYSGLINFLKKEKDLIALVGAYELVRFHDNLISRILSANEIKKEDYCKYIYQLCYASYVLLSEAPDKSFLTEIKRIRWKAVSDEHKRLAVERIRLLFNYVAEHPIDISNVISSFNENVRTLLG